MRMSLKSRRITRGRHQVLQGTYSNGTWQVSLGELGARDCSLLCDVPLGDEAESRSGHTCAGAVNLHGWGGRREKAPAPRYRMILDGRGSHTTTTTRQYPLDPVPTSFPANRVRSGQYLRVGPPRAVVGRLSSWELFIYFSERSSVGVYLNLSLLSGRRSEVYFIYLT